MKNTSLVFCRLSDIISITSDGQSIINITMSDRGKWETADGAGMHGIDFFQIASVVNGKYRFRQITRIECSTGNENKEGFDTLKECCDLVFIVFEKGKTPLVHGIEIDALAEGGFTGSKIRNARFDYVPHVLYLEGSLQSESCSLAPILQMTKKQLLSL